MRSYQNRVAAAAAAPDAALIEPQAPTWAATVLVPLTQNLLGGAAVTAGVAIAWRWAAGELPPDWWLPAGSIGALFAVGFTVLRFFGDDVGLLTAAFRAGRRSRDAEVNYLIMQMETYRDAVTASSGSATTTEAEKRIAVANATLRNARALLRVIYEHGAKHATREEMAQRQMGQRDWERAKALCIAAGVVDQLLQPTAGDYAQALKRVEEVHGGAVADMRKSRTARVAWAV